jgi:hypothetical protein
MKGVRAPRAWLVAAAVALGSTAGCSAPAGPASPAGPPAAPRNTTATRDAAAPTASAPEALDGCLDPGQAHLLAPVADGSRSLQAVAIGAGSRAVILSEQSDRNPCGWLPLVPKLTAAGYQVVLWDYGTGAPADELRAILAAARSAGARRVALVGASKGAKTSVVAAATAGDRVQGVVSLSAESVLAPDIQVDDYAARLATPVLFVTAARDGYGAAEAGRDFVREAPSRDKRLLTVPGSDHGVDLLTGTQAATVTGALLDFLHRVLD